ncbi:MAG: 4Fe-4S dicluster domain-containing protein [Acidobacteriota bacterium]
MTIDRKLLKEESIQPLLKALRESGRRILAPQRTGSAPGAWHRVLGPEEQIDLEEMTTLSPKSGFLPPVEEILRFRNEGKRIVIEGGRIQPQPTVIFGSRPCDTRALHALDTVFLREPEDRFFRERRALTTIVTFSCRTANPDCFCTSVSGGPGDPEGSDLLLTAVGEQGFLVEVVSPKGEDVVQLAPGLFSPAGEIDKQAFLASVPARFSLVDVRKRLPALFNDEEFWREQSLACLGCSTCAFVCPNCSCFDIQDEADLKGGARLRCWDSCGQRLFTLHASGHNPRSAQSQRWRQRIMHKFSYLPEKEGLAGCVGCGRCSRSCPAGMNLLERLTAIVETQV